MGNVPCASYQAYYSTDVLHNSASAGSPLAEKQGDQTLNAVLVAVSAFPAMAFFVETIVYISAIPLAGGGWVHARLSCDIGLQTLPAEDGRLCAAAFVQNRRSYTGCTDAPNPSGESGRPWCYVEAQAHGNI